MITLASDFGSPYPAAMKGVILHRCDARLVDVAHDLPRQDPRAAAFWLRFVLPEFPPAVHLVVVDPGVGTDRTALVVRAGEHVLVGPDNGVLLPPARALAAVIGDADARDVDVFTYAHDEPASATFHGRDVFAPAAATVHEAIRGIGDDALDTCPGRDDLNDFNDLDGLNDLDSIEPADGYVDLALPDAEPTETGVDGEVLVVDDFGNAITNVPGDVLAGRTGSTVSVDGDPVPVVETFAAVGAGERLVTVGSHGYVELDVNRGRGDDAFGLEPGDSVSLRWPA